MELAFLFPPNKLPLITLFILVLLAFKLTAAFSELTTELVPAVVAVARVVPVPTVPATAAVPAPPLLLLLFCVKLVLFAPLLRIVRLKFLL